MSQENVELAERLISDFNRRDLPAVTEAFDREIEWRPGGPAAVERAVYRGRDQVSDGLAATWDAWELFHLAKHEVRDLGDSVLWLGRAQMRGGASHVELDQEFAVHLEIDRGKVVRIHGFLVWQEALEAAGLSEWAMSQAIPPLETIRAGFDAFNRGDYDAWVAVYDENVEFLDLAETPDTATFRGHAGARAWLAKLQEAWGEGFQFEPGSITQGDDAVLVDTRASGVGAESGVPIEMTVYVVLRYRDQKVVWTRAFIDRADALEAAGLRE